MIQKPAGYDEAQAMTGEYERLELGGHICVIKSCKVVTTANGAQQLSIAFDIDESDTQKQGGFYTRQYESNKQRFDDAKWPNGGTTRVGIDGKSVPFFKGFTTVIMESNPGYVWRWDETTLKGKRFGGIFGEEEYMAKDGTVKKATKLRFIRSIDVIKAGVEIPAVKTLSGTPAPAVAAPTNSYMQELDDSEELPFN